MYIVYKYKISNGFKVSGCLSFYKSTPLFKTCLLIQIILVYLFTCSLKVAKLSKVRSSFNVLDNLLVILLVDFHVHFCLLLVKRRTFKGFIRKKVHQQRTWGQTVK